MVFGTRFVSGKLIMEYFDSLVLAWESCSNVEPIAFDILNRTKGLIHEAILKEKPVKTMVTKWYYHHYHPMQQIVSTRQQEMMV